MTRPLPFRQRPSALPLTISTKVTVPSQPARSMLSLCAMLCILYAASPHARADENAKEIGSVKHEVPAPSSVITAPVVSVNLDAAVVHAEPVHVSVTTDHDGTRELLFGETETPEPLGLTARQKALKAFRAAAASASLAAHNATGSVVGVTNSAAGTVTRAAGNIHRGIASWYHDKFHNRLTANGERYNMNELTAAHKSLPFGTRLCAHYPVTGKSVLVRINDRGPFIEGRIIDFSKASAKALGIFYTKPDMVSLLPPDDRRCSASAKAGRLDADQG